MRKISSKAGYVATMGVLLALCAALTAIESAVSAFLPVGMRIGLANIVIMTAAVCVGLPSAFVLTVLKAAFVLLTRGITAGGMSLCGGVLAFAVTALLLSKTKAGYTVIGLISALAHSAGQIALSSIMTGSVYTLYYAPLLMLVSAAAGIATGTVSGVIIPKAIKILVNNE